VARTASPRNPFVRSIALVLGVVRRERVRAALIGGFALPFHGVHRATGDVDFLVGVEGSDALHEALVAAGARCLHRSEDAANYSASKGLAAVDFIYARRERAREMLRRARPMLSPLESQPHGAGRRAAPLTARGSGRRAVRFQRPGRQARTSPPLRRRVPCVVWRTCSVRG